MKKSANKVLIACALVGMLSLDSCKKYDDGPGFSLRSKKARLVGEWEVVSVEFGGSNMLDPDYEIEMEFDKDGDVEITYSYDGYNYSYDGDWEFSSDKEELEVKFAGYSEDLEIKRLTNKEFWYEDEDGYEWELEAK